MDRNVINLLLDWVPFLIFMGLLVFFMLRMRPQQKAARDYMQEQVAQTKRMVEQLERIAAALEKRAGS